MTDTTTDVAVTAPTLPVPRLARPHAVVLLSGGIDSTVALTLYDAMMYRVTAVSVDYGQRHHRELAAAAEIAEMLGAAHVVVPMPFLGSYLPGSALTDHTVRVPHGHYADRSMAATVVPNRNAIMANIAAGIAIAHGADVLALGVHAGDHPVYPDCRPEWVTALRRLVAVGNDRPVRVEAPFVRHTKTAVVSVGHRLGAPLHLTWSCYEGRETHCGRCGTCVERREAFAGAGVTDPTIYGYGPA